LLKSREPAIRGTAFIYRTPRVILCFGTISNADDADGNSQYEQQELQGRLAVAPCCKRVPSCFIPNPPANEARRIAADVAKLPDL
jgi:hypothetical protein